MLRALPTLATVAGAGCMRYEPMPLTRSAVDASLARPSEDKIRARAAELRHPMLPPVTIDLERGLTPDAAAVLAVIVNPSLRGQRARRSLASAQLLQAGLLPNPTFDVSLDPVIGGNTVGTVMGYNFGPSWEISGLISHEAKVAAGRAQSESVRLDVAWQEWQVAQGAKKAVYDLLALRAQARQAEEVDRRLTDNADLVRRAVDAHQRTLLDLSAAEAASQKAHADFLTSQRDARHQRLALNQALGFAPEVEVRLAPDVSLPSRLRLPPDAELLADIDDRRLDLLALRRGYESGEQSLRAAVLAQFPRILIGLHKASDTTNVHTLGPNVTIDLPIFDRNQGNVAIQQATRQQLFEEYAGRLFDARSTAAQGLDDIGSITEQITAAEAAIGPLERLVKTYEAAVGQHNADVLSYYTAQSDLAQKRIDLLKLKQQLMDTKIALEIATGRYLPEPPAPPESPKGATTREAAGTQAVPPSRPTTGETQP